MVFTTEELQQLSQKKLFEEIENSIIGISGQLTNIAYLTQRARELAGQIENNIFEISSQQTLMDDLNSKEKEKGDEVVHEVRNFKKIFKVLNEKNIGGHNV